MNTLLIENYFAFEADFVEDNIRCIPMIVRFKLDACGIKLKLKEWSKMREPEREYLASLPCTSPDEVAEYKNYLLMVIRTHTGGEGTEIPVQSNPPWIVADKIPQSVIDKVKELDASISVRQWMMLSELQRFALLKLSYPGHENKNFPKAMKEFNLC
jgi:hypothetical protein